MTNNDKALAAFNDGMNALRWLLNHAKESPRKQIGGLMECFTIKDNHTTKADETLERLWEHADTIRLALTPQSSADLGRVREALIKANAFCQGESSYTAYPEIQEALRILDEVIGRE